MDKSLDIGAFTISVPKEWEYVKLQGEDSFVGEIKISDTISLTFDVSNMGYANHLLPTKEEYLKAPDRYHEFSTAINTHKIVSNCDANYVYKTIWPKMAGKGMTGIYIQSRNSSFNFQMCGSNLSAKDGLLALKAFKTITFKK